MSQAGFLAPPVSLYALMTLNHGDYRWARIFKYQKGIYIQIKLAKSQDYQPSPLSMVLHKQYPNSLSSSQRVTDSSKRSPVNQPSDTSASLYVLLILESACLFSDQV